MLPQWFLFPWTLIHDFYVPAQFEWVFLCRLDESITCGLDLLLVFVFYLSVKLILVTAHAFYQIWSLIAMSQVFERIGNTISGNSCQFR